MGGLILLFLFLLGLVILLTPALRARARMQEERDVNVVHEEVLRRLELHRKRRDGEADGDDGATGGKKP